MITRSQLVEELREYQIRSQRKWAALLIFSPKPQIRNRKDVVVALIFALFFCFAEKACKEKGWEIFLTFVDVAVEGKSQFSLFD
ncbi:uncharacterized protein LOC110025961 isoform X2 [Phalaenopsis equestris]|uniref:uncharacterized protein LOC110025961 isoform X2 n=1 Tax=Phalaenopsis equestris TaxID=78828 RepID=UPI0009E3905D|nr:uncharacterized protein LOC110025961 isoform X2 [Phalaenopsis equestris]